VGGEQQKQSVEQQAVPVNEWDVLSEQAETEAFESDEPNFGESEPLNAESDEFRRKFSKSPPKLEGVRREIARRFAPNTLPNVETLAKDVSREGLSYIDELCENWPIFAHTEKVKIEGKEIDFPQFFPKVKYEEGDEYDYVGFLSSRERPDLAYEELKKEIGKKNATVFVEASLDNPLVSRVTFSKYHDNLNSDHACVAIGPDSLLHAHIRLIDEALPLDYSLKYIEARLAGVKYEKGLEEEELECYDTIYRSMIAYHEIGHDMDFLINFLKLNEKREVSSAEIEEARGLFYKRRALNIECSKSFPDPVFAVSNEITEDELRIMASRRGFSEEASLDPWHLSLYNHRQYCEMPCESVSDRYAQTAVCRRHRDHYYAKNQHERDTNPEKKHLPIYGEIICIGTTDNERTHEFIDQELMGCGVIAGKKVTLYEEYIDPRIKVNPETHLVELPEDFDYEEYQEKQKAQAKVVYGHIAHNPVNGVFELIGEDDEVDILFGGYYYRQQDENGRVELISGDFGSDHPTYRLRFEDDEESAEAYGDVAQLGSTAFDHFLGIDETKESCAMFINDNEIHRVILPKGGFSGVERMVDADDGNLINLPSELYVYNGIPKAKVGEILYEVVPCSNETMQQIKEKLKLV
jgi:hypothetical protein